MGLDCELLESMNGPNRHLSTPMYHVYILLCADGTLYTGITNNLERRLKEHQTGKGARYTRRKGVRKILYTEKHPSRSSALKREAEIKKWSREKKIRLIHSGSSPRIKKSE
jgi:putative endonuclease